MSRPTERSTRSPDGARVVVYDHEGGGGSAAAAADGPTVVLAHGWCLTHESWQPVVTELQRRRPGVRVVTYDQPGHGGSSPVPSRRVEVRDLGATLRAVLADHVPTGDVVLGGHSMGGMTIMALAGLDPALVHSRVRGVLLAATVAHIDADRRPVPGERLVMGLLSLAPHSWPGLPTTRALTEANLFGVDPDPDAVRATAAQTTSTRARTTAAYFHALDRHDEVASLTNLVGIPTAIVTGARDRVTPVKWSRKMAARIPGATFWAVPGAGHMLPYESTDLLVDRLELLLDADPARLRSSATWQ